MENIEISLGFSHLDRVYQFLLYVSTISINPRYLSRTLPRLLLLIVTVSVSVGSVVRNAAFLRLSQEKNEGKSQESQLMAFCVGFSHW